MLKIMIVFSVIAGIDKLLNNKFGLGEKFDEGFLGLPGLALTIIGIYTLSPVIGRLLTPILGPLAKIMHTDPSVFISSVLAPDLGGLPTSQAIANTKLVGEFNGAILASMLGTSISFTIPVAVGVISKDDFKFFAKGALAGIMTIPLGMLVSGFMMRVPIKDIIFNLMPVIIFSLSIIIGLIKSPDKMILMFEVLGNVIIKISTLGLILSIINFMFGIEIISGMLSFEEAGLIVFEIAIILSGAFSILYLISTKMHKYISKIGDKYKLDQYSIIGIFSSLVNCIPMYGIYDKMNEKGKVLNAAFVVSGAFTFGGQLGYISSSLPSATNSFIVGKLVSAIAAVIVASKMVERENSKEGFYENK